MSDERLGEISVQLARIADGVHNLHSLLSPVVASFDEPIHPEATERQCHASEFAFFSDVPAIFDATPLSELARINNETIDKVLDEQKEEMERQIKNGFRPQLQEDIQK